MFSKRHAIIYFTGFILGAYCVNILSDVGQATFEEIDTSDILSLVRAGEAILLVVGIPCALLVILSAVTEKTRPYLALPAAVIVAIVIAINLTLAAVEGLVRSDLEAAKNCGLMAAYLACILYSIVRFYRNETKGVAGATEEIAMDAV